MDVNAMLGRIGLSDTPHPTVEGLRRLQDHHMRAVPFENLDILLGRPLDLSPDALFEKIVIQRRGGYCFELNTLYGALLRALCFDPIPMLGRVWLRDPAEVPPRTHLMNRVRIDGVDWVSDVGFGGRASRVPLRLDDPTPIEDGDGYIRIIPDARFGYLVQRQNDSRGWDAQYSFQTAPAHMSDILTGHHWTERHPDSHFRHGLGVGLFTPNGRSSFYAGILRRRGDDIAPREVKGLEPALAILETDFGLSLQLTNADRTQLARFT